MGFNYQETRVQNQNPYQVDQRTQFNELVVGAGTQQIKQVRTGVKFQDKNYMVKATSGLPIIQFDQDSNVSFSSDGAGKGELVWPSGNYIKALGATMEVNGSWLILGGCRATGYTTRVGSTDHSGCTVSEASVNTFSIEIYGGLVTNFTKNS
jgi:hypothetical protein